MWSRRSKHYLLAIGAIVALAGIITMPANVGATTVQSKICAPFNAPTITAPANTTQTSASSVHVVGTASPNMTVEVLRNNSSTGSTTATPSGDYAIDVPLLSGTNNIAVSTTDDCGTIKTSSQIQATRTTQHFAPMAPSPITYTPPATTTAPAPTTPAPTQTAVPATTPATNTTTTSTTDATNSQAITPSTTGATAVLITPAAWNMLITNPPTTVAAVPIAVTANPTVSQKQVVTKPKAGETVASQRTWVGGTAQPLTSVVIYVNKTIVAKVDSDDTGTYGTMVQLKQGNNQINVLAQSDDGQATLREINVRLTSNISIPAIPPNATISQSDKWVITGVALSFGVGGILITSSLWWHTRLLQKQKVRVKHD